MAGIADNVPGGPDDIMRQLTDIRRELKELRSARGLEASTIGAGGLTVNDTGSITLTGGGTLTVNSGSNISVAGDLDVTGTETVIGALDVTGTETVSGTLHVTGDTIIGGTLSLPNGIIDNAALVSPVAFGQFGTSAIGFAVPTAGATPASGTITVPAGYSQAIVQCNAHCSAANTTGSPDFLHVGAEIAGVTPSPPFNVASASGGWTYAGGSATRVLTGLSGGTIAVACKVITDYANWAASASNYATVDAIAIFLR